MSEPFVGEIKMVGFNFAPKGYAMCNGQILPISQNTALFSLLGTFYGGNGQSTFALPDLRSRVPIHQGQGPGLSPYVIGQVGGVENVTLLTSNLPPHNHFLNVNSNGGDQASPQNNYLAVESTGTSLNYTAAPNTQMNPQVVSVVGNGIPHTIVQPYLVVTFVIALQGIFPSRN